MSLTRIQPSALDITLNYRANTFTANYITFGDGTTQTTAGGGSAAGSYANSAFIQANAAFAQANSGAGGSSAGPYANAAFDVANSASIYANGAFVQANSAYQSQNVSGSYANSAYTQANTATTNAATADSKAVTAGSYANSAYTQANTATNNAADASLYANGAFIQANAAYNSQNTTGTYTNTAFDFANSAGSYANSAFTKANNALPSTGGTINGSLTVTQDVSVTGNLLVLGNTTSINTSSFTVQDTLLILGLGNYTSDLLDIGFASHYNAGANAHTGIFRDASEKQWMFFEGYTPEVTPNNNIIITDPSFSYANVRARDFTGNLIANTVVVNGYNLFTYTTNAYTQANTATTNAATADSKAVTAGQYANSAYTQANTATTNAATADSKAVTAGSYANSAYTQANTATTNAATADGKAVTAGSYANSAFSVANSAALYANGAFSYANSAYTRANNSINANSGGTITNNLTITGNLTSGNIILSSANSLATNLITTTSGTNANLTIDPDGAGYIIITSTTPVQLQNATSSVSNTTGTLVITGGIGLKGNLYTGNIVLSLANSITFGDGTVQTTSSGSASTYANSAFLQANSAYAAANNATPGRTINFVIDGGGSLISTGSKGNVLVNISGTILSWSVLGDVSGNVTVDISKSTYATFPTFTASGGTSPSLTTSQKSYANIINWTGFTTVSANDIIQYTVSGTPANVGLITVVLNIG